MSTSKTQSNVRWPGIRIHFETPARRPHSLPHLSALAAIALALGLVAGEARALDFNKFLNDAQKIIQDAAKSAAQPPAKPAPPAESHEQSASPGAPATAAAPATVPQAPAPAYDQAMVRDIQTMLNELGYNAGQPDGIYGPGTRNAIQAFQHDRSLPVDGKPSHGTVSALQAAVKSGHQADPAAHQATYSPPEKMVADVSGSDGAKNATGKDVFILTYLRDQPEVLDQGAKVIRDYAAYLLDGIAAQVKAMNEFDLQRKAPEWKQAILSRVAALPATPRLTGRVHFKIGEYDFEREAFKVGLTIGPWLRPCELVECGGGSKRPNPGPVFNLDVDRYLKMSALPVPRAEAEAIKNRYGQGFSGFEVEYAIDLRGYSDESFNGELVSLKIYAVEKEFKKGTLGENLAGPKITVISTKLLRELDVASLPRRSDEMAAREAEKEAARKKVEEAKRLAEEEDRRNREASKAFVEALPGKFAACEKRPVVQREACYRDSCALNDHDRQRADLKYVPRDVFFKCESLTTRARNAASSAEIERRSQADARKTACAMRYNQVQLNIPGLHIPESERNAAVETCLRESTRTASGPDVIEIRLGMGMIEARSLARREVDNNRGERAKEPRPFMDGTLYISRDGNQGIAIYSFQNNGQEEKIAGVSRRIYFDKDGPAEEQISRAMRAKYGKEHWHDGNGMLLWAPEAHLPVETCAETQKFIIERGDWTRPWQAGGSRPELARPRTTVVSSDRVTQCMQEANLKVEKKLAEKGLDHHNDGEKYWIAYNALTQHEIEQCQLVPTTGASGANTMSDRGERLPMMIDVAGEPADYAAYEGCGPLLFIKVNQKATGIISDISTVLFDPSWIAEMPPFMFNPKKPAGEVVRF